MGIKDKITNALTVANTKIVQAQFQVKKHAPLIMTITGVAGLGATAYLAYRAHGKVATITEEIEERRANGDEVPTGETIGRVAIAILPPVVTGSLSIAAILGSYHVLNGRNQVLATALSTAIAENKSIKEKIRQHYPDALTAPATPDGEGVIVDEETGKEKKVVTAKIEDRPSLEGIWFNKSDEYVKDDHTYNLAFIKAKSEVLDAKLQRTGFLSLNEVYSALNIPKSEANYRIGSLMGWTDGVSGNYFDLDYDVVRVEDEETGVIRPEIYIHWPDVTSLYDKVDFDKGFGDYV